MVHINGLPQLALRLQLPSSTTSMASCPIIERRRSFDCLGFTTLVTLSSVIYEILSLIIFT